MVGPHQVKLIGSKLIHTAIVRIVHKIVDRIQAGVPRTRLAIH
jgi:hypothetical protein